MPRGLKAELGPVPPQAWRGWGWGGVQAHGFLPHGCDSCSGLLYTLGFGKSDYVFDEILIFILCYLAGERT